MRRNRSLVRWALLTSLVLIAAGCRGQDSGEEAPKPGGVFRVELSEPGSIDPPHAQNSEEIILVNQLFEGLVIYDDVTAKVKPGMATRWDQNEDATKFTFTLRRDAKFSNGEPVTAESFVRGWTRGTARDEAGEVAYHLARIKGYKEHHDDGAAADLAGVLAKDEDTLEVTLTEPDADFVTRTGHSPFMPVPSDEAIKGQKPSWGEFPIGNGPFMLKGPEPWKHNRSITMVPNPNYSGGRSRPTLDEVRFMIFADYQTAYTEFQAGNLDWTRIPVEKTKEAEAQNRGNFIKQRTAGLDYLGAIVTKAPTDNKRFRQAISLAVDRALINQAIFNELRQPADSIIPPLMPGYTKGACKLCHYDPATAKKLFEESGVKSGSKLPILFNGGGGHEQWVQAVADQIKTNLGIDVEIISKGPPFSEYLNFIESDEVPGSVNRLAWGMDYPTPENFLFPLLDSASVDNHSQYKNVELEGLLKKAGAETDEEKRLEIYRQAEALALDDMPIIPMWFRVQFRLVRFDNFGGLRMDVNEYPTLTTAFSKSAQG